MATQLSTKRKKIAREFESQMNTSLRAVGLLNARFAISFTLQTSPEGEIEVEGSQCLFNDRGADLIEFRVGLNVGEPVKPLHKVASGGEVSRIMLCIKSLLAESDNIDSLVFDEIDNGISGKYAQIVGKKMQEMSLQHQLIVITHLPQIAAQGKEHFSVHKYERNGRTQVQVKQLDLDQRIEDIAKLLGGKTVTAHARANARELLAEVT
jgi:DNA repair protein RecN (Recombination protein N)